MLGCFFCGIGGHSGSGSGDVVSGGNFIKVTGSSSGKGIVSDDGSVSGGSGIGGFKSNSVGEGCGCGIDRSGGSSSGRRNGSASNNL